MKTYKKFAGLLLFLLPVLFLSCNEDDEPTPEELLIGTWTLSDQDIEIFINGELVPAVLLEQFGVDTDTLQAFPDNTTVEFKSDKSYIVTAPDEGEGSGTWVLSSDGKQLTIDAADSDPLIFQVETLTSTNANIVYSEEGPFEYEGNEYDLKVDLHVSFTK